MDNTFHREEFNLDCGFQLNHTFGVSAENSTSKHLHDVDKFLIYYFIKGSGNIRIDGNYFDIEEGDFILLNPSEMFCCNVNKSIYHERLTLHITKAILQNFPADCSSFFAPFFNREKKLCHKIKKKDVVMHGLHNKFTEIHRLVQAPSPENKLLSICKVIEFFSMLDKLGASAAYSVTAASSNDVINAVLDYLNRHFSENTSVESVAKAFNLCSSYLTHLFKEHVGISLWNYVILKRINLFNELVSKGGSIEESCYRAGFQNYSNFFRLYKKHTKITPSEFKQKAKVK